MPSPSSQQGGSSPAATVSMSVVEELMKKIRALEEGQAELKREVSKLLTLERRGALCQSTCSSSRRPRPASRTLRVGRAALSLSGRHHMMILNSLGQAVHVLDLQGKVLYRNRCAELLYGYSAPEAIGQDVTKLLVHPSDMAQQASSSGIYSRGNVGWGSFTLETS